MLLIQGKGFQEHRLRRSWSRHTWFLSGLCSLSALSWGLSFLICSLWVLLQNEGRQVAGTQAALFSLWRTSWGQSWYSVALAQTWLSSPLQCRAPSSHLVLEMKPISHLDGTPWTWMPSYLQWFELYPCGQPTKHVVPGGLLVLARVFPSAALNPLLLMVFLPSAPHPPSSLVFVCLTARLFWAFRSHFSCLFPCRSPHQVPHVESIISSLVFPQHCTHKL